MNKADQAIAYMAEKGVTAYEAAKVLGITPRAIYKQQKLIAERGVCPCCNQLLPAKKET